MRNEPGATSFSHHAHTISSSSLHVQFSAMDYHKRLTDFFKKFGIALIFAFKFIYKKELWWFSIRVSFLGGTKLYLTRFRYCLLQKEGQLSFHIYDNEWNDTMLRKTYNLLEKNIKPLSLHLVSKKDMFIYFCINKKRGYNLYILNNFTALLCVFFIILLLLLFCC